MCYNKYETFRFRFRLISIVARRLKSLRIIIPTDVQFMDRLDRFIQSIHIKEYANNMTQIAVA